MIRINSSAPPGATHQQVQTDCDIPLKVKLSRESREVPSYWRIGDFERSLVEVGIDPLSARLVSVAVTLVHPERTADAPATLARRPSDKGVPILELARLQGHFSDGPGSVLLHLGSDFVWLAFTEGAPRHREVRLGPPRFLIGDDDAWVGAVPKGLSATQQEELGAELGGA